MWTTRYGKKLWQWAKRRHPNKGKWWIKDRYFPSVGTRKWVFGCENKDGKFNRLMVASDTPIVRHIKVLSDLNPFDPSWEIYIEGRLGKTMKLEGKPKSLWNKQKGRCPVCQQPITDETRWHVHHKLPKALGGDDRLSNLVLLHPNCHRQVHNKNPDNQELLAHASGLIEA